MPRRRHEEESRSSSSSSSPRPAGARSRSRETSSSGSRSSSRPSPRPKSAASTPRSSPRPRPAPVASSAPAPAPARSSPIRTQRSTPRTYRASSDDDSYRARSDKDKYSLFEGIFRNRNDRASSNDQDRATSHGESLFGDMVRTLLCPPAPMVSDPSPCETQGKVFQNCLHDFETAISKCQLYMNTLSRCKKNPDDFKLYDVVGDDRDSSDKESRFLILVRAMLCPSRTKVVSQDASKASVAAPVSLCDTQDKTFQDCLHDFETDISKCQLYKNMLSSSKKKSDSKSEA